MKIDLTAIDQEQFDVVSHVVNGQVVFLVTPHRYSTLEEAQRLHAKRWTPQTLIFRSSVWDVDGNLISAGFRKFFNWGEARANAPVPSSLKGCTIVEKMDGSLFIVSKFQGEYIFRTRGSVDARNLDNGHELEKFKADILPKIEHLFDGAECSVLFEWVSPEQRIVLDHSEPEWHLLGVVHHDRYTYMSQSQLDDLAEVTGLKRPATYTFSTIEDLLANIETWKQKEGVCVYSSNGQQIHKVKTPWYLALHKMKEDFGSIDKIVDVWMTSWGSPDYKTTEVMVCEQFDYELWGMVRGDVSRICDAWKDVLKILAGMQKFVDDTLLPMGDPNNPKVRAKQAEKVLQSYGATNRAGFVFKMLVGQELNIDEKKKLLWQCLKK